MKFLKKLFDENYCEVKMERREGMEEIKCPKCHANCEIEEIIDYDDYRIVGEDGMVYTYTCPECDCYIQVFVNDK